MPQTDETPQQDIPIDEPADDQSMNGDMPTIPQDNQGDIPPIDQNMDDGQPQDMVGDSIGQQGGEIGDDSTMGIINQLSDTDKKAVRAYAESMLNRDETSNTMAESFIFTKKQIDEIHEMLVNNSDDDNDTINKTNKKITNHNKKSPFDSPFA